MENKRKYKIVASDLDGTLLNKEQIVSEENFCAIAQMKRLGVEFVPTTGRGLNEIAPSLINSPDINYIITSNGAMVFDTNTGKQTQTCLSSGKCQSKHHQGLPGWLIAQQSTCKAGDTVSIPHLGGLYVGGQGSLRLTTTPAPCPKANKRGHHNETCPPQLQKSPCLPHPGKNPGSREDPAR